MPKKNFFPEIITKLPEADIPIEGVHSHLFQGQNQQFVFMRNSPAVKIDGGVTNPDIFRSVNVVHR